MSVWPSCSRDYVLMWGPDEAQTIKNRSAQGTKAAIALRAKFRWCLTGTPIQVSLVPKGPSDQCDLTAAANPPQNNVEELFSLFQFLRAAPLDNWQLFRERIIQPIKEERTRLAMKRLHVRERDAPANWLGC